MTATSATTVIAEARKKGKRMLLAAQFCAIVLLSAIATMIWQILPTTIQWKSEIADYLLVVAVTGVVNVTLISGAMAIAKRMTRARARAAKDAITDIANRDPRLRDAYAKVGPYLRIGDIGTDQQRDIPMHPRTAKAIAEALPAWVMALDHDLVAMLKPPFESATLRAAHQVEFDRWLALQEGRSP